MQLHAFLIGMFTAIVLDAFIVLGAFIVFGIKFAIEWWIDKKQ